MKTKKVVLFLVGMVSAISIHCSREDDATDEFSLPPAQPSEESPEAPPESVPPDSIPGPDPESSVAEPAIYYNGYANYTNARLIVNSETVSVAPEFQYVVGCMNGSDNAWGYGTNISGLLLQNDGAVYVGTQQVGSCSLMYVSGGFIEFEQWIYRWNLEYTIVINDGKPDEIAITGTGRGSHIWEIPYDAWVQSDITFEYHGVQIEGTSNYEGSFKLEERSPNQKYNLSVSGTATLERELEIPLPR
ncbi:hypothetical protein [Robiginitalea sp. SC105]|uniref:hypothetical protein n=1 Tax=Robiginitalea sp. SC105 TaxID=2762332 RepID=UPI001639A16A|nr:hypothetical protein [Robiginitalea sp. SC105]MBC2839059.1 hypothetical protein [Robiginitalea sp. SC105]